MKTYIEQMLEFVESYDPGSGDRDNVRWAMEKEALRLVAEEKENLKINSLEAILNGDLPDFIAKVCIEIQRGWPNMGSTHIDLAVLTKIWFDYRFKTKGDK